MRNRLFILLLATSVLILTGGCNRAPAEATATTSGLIIITATDVPASTATSLAGYPSPTDIAPVVPTLPTSYPGISQSTAQPTLEPTAYPGPAVSNLTPTVPAEISPTDLPEAITSTPTSTSAAQLTSTFTSVTVTPTVTPTSVPAGGTTYPLPAITPTSPVANITPTSALYPGPAVSPTPAPSAAASPTLSSAYPGPVEVTPTSPATALPTPTATISGTPPVIPEEVPPVPAVTPPPPGSLVRIWYSWSPEQAQILDDVMDAFQDMYPGIRFEVTNFPPADLRRRYETAVYNGGGPGLLLAPAEWGPAYYESGLVRDLSPYASAEFISGINPAALGTGLYKGALISLPVSQQGVVLYRNRQLIPAESATFDQLIAAARGATRAGNLGAYFDRGAFFSAGSLSGLGGAVMDANQYPAFDSPAGLAWLDLMAAFDVAGAVGMNTNRDLELFSKGRIGYIIEGTWQIDSLVQALGEENLAIDPWPEYGTGHLSGFVRADSVYLNPNTRPNDASAAMLFMGYLLTPDVQQVFAEIGMIPVALDANPRPLFVAQAATALARGTAYPPVANPRLLTAYWEGLELAIREVFTRRIDPQAALIHAEDLVSERLSEIIP